MNETVSFFSHNRVSWETRRNMEASMYEAINSEARPRTAACPAVVSTAAVSTAEDVLGALKWRYATKIFDPQRPVSEADVQVILEAYG
jgi:hypothetical protein